MTELLVMRLLYEIGGATGLRQREMKGCYERHGIHGLQRCIIAAIDRTVSERGRLKREVAKLREDVSRFQQTDLTKGSYFAPKTEIHEGWRQEYLRRLKNREEI